MIVLAALAGAAIATGLVLGVRELIGRARPPAGPAPRRPTPTSPSRFISLSDRSRRQAVLAVVAGLGVLAITRWPVAGLAAGLAVIFLPRVLSTRGQRERTAKLEGLEQ